MISHLLTNIPSEVGYRSSVTGLGSFVNLAGGEELCVMPPSIRSIAQTSSVLEILFDYSFPVNYSSSFFGSNSFESSFYE
ncbi:unnamed protein product [Ilex paraguariensis]|uniref:Uncharacterized protein n=1 Tax=Ilex paraguariensis TaxID=185542 RepID=A0ABC8UED6_9AQUA